MITKTERSVSLRIGPGVSGPVQQGQSGVVVVEDVPAGSFVTAVVDRPDRLDEVSAGDSAPWAFEIAPLPGPIVTAAAGGARFERTNVRILQPTGSGPVAVAQQVPVWAAFGTPVTGSCRARGRIETAFRMPGFTGTLPNLSAANRRLLRWRWTGTVVAAESQNARLTDPVTGAAVVPDGFQQAFAGRLLNGSIVPGTVLLTVLVGGSNVLLRDTGDGRLVGLRLSAAGVIEARGDGTVDYVAGTFRILYGLPDGSGAPDGAATLAADYEHECRYLPLDALLAWDALL